MGYCYCTLFPTLLPVVCSTTSMAAALLPSSLSNRFSLSLSLSFSSECCTVEVLLIVFNSLCLSELQRWKLFWVVELGFLPFGLRLYGNLIVLAKTYDGLD